MVSVCEMIGIWVWTSGTMSPLISMGVHWANAARMEMTKDMRSMSMLIGFRFLHSPRIKLKRDNIFLNWTFSSRTCIADSQMRSVLNDISNLVSSFYTQLRDALTKYTSWRCEEISILIYLFNINKWMSFRCLSKTKEEEEDGEEKNWSIFRYSSTSK